MTMKTENRTPPSEETDPQKLREQLEKLRKLIDAAKIVNSSLDIDTLLGLILKTALDTVHAERGTVYLLDEAKRELWSKVFEGADLVEIRLPFGKGIAGNVGATGETINIAEAYSDPRFNPEIDQATGYRTHTVLCMPMRNKDEKIIGVFQLLNKRGGVFTADDVELLDGLSLHASIAIENAHLAQSMIQNERLSAVGKMASTIIHDIKNPMSVLRLSAQVIKQQVESEHTKRIADEMIGQIDRFVAMAQEILDFSRGISELRIKEVKFTSLLETIFRFLEKDMALRKITLASKVEYAGTVAVDPDKIMRVFYNIFGNASDAMPRGGVIHVGAQCSGEHLYMTIRDEGVGMPPEICQRIFEPFVTHGKRYGTGLGMAIVKKIMDDHHATIAVESKVGGGTTVTLRLPMKAAHHVEKEQRLL